MSSNCTNYIEEIEDIIDEIIREAESATTSYEWGDSGSRRSSEAEVKKLKKELLDLIEKRELEHRKAMEMDCG